MDKQKVCEREQNVYTALFHNKIHNSMNTKNKIKTHINLQNSKLAWSI